MIAPTGSIRRLKSNEPRQTDLIFICADLQLLIENENLNPLGLTRASQEPDLLNQLNHKAQVMISRVKSSTV